MAAMRPRTGYRVGVVCVPLMLVLLVLALVEGLWLLAVVAALGIATMLVNLRQARRIGMHWNGPKTFRELRELQREHKNGAAG